MAKKNEAEKTLADLQAQELKLRSTIADLEKDLADLDFSNVDRAVSQIAASRAALDGAQAALKMLAPKIAAAQQAVEAARLVERENQAQDLRKQAADARKKAIGALVGLDQALGALGAVHRELKGKHHLPPRKPLPAELNQAVGNALEHLLKTDPEVLGLPPLPTQAEKRRGEAVELVNRLRARLDGLRAISTRDGFQLDRKHASETCELDLQRAEAALAAI